MNDKFRLEAHCVILGTDIVARKKYVLSTNTDCIDFPKFVVTADDLKNMNNRLISFAKTFIPSASDIELIPQLITLHTPYIPNIDNVLNIVYGFILEYRQQIENSNWIEFDDLDPVPQSNIIFDVIQKLY